MLHSIEIKRPLKFLAAHDANRVAGVRWNENFRIDARDLNVSRIRYVHRERTRSGTEGIRIVLRPFVALANRVYDTEKPDGLAPRAHRFDNNEVIQLDLVLALHPNPELKRCCV